MKQHLFAIFKWTILIASLFPIILCFGILSNDVGRFYHYLVLFTVVDVIVGILAYLTACVID